MQVIWNNVYLSYNISYQFIDFINVSLSDAITRQDNKKVSVKCYRVGQEFYWWLLAVHPGDLLLIGIYLQLETKIKYNLGVNKP